MKKAVTSLVAIGIGAAAYSLSDRRKKNKFQSFIDPITNVNFDQYLNKKTWKKLKKKVLK